MRIPAALALACALVIGMAGVADAAAALPQNDAGSGQDAPNGPTPSFRITPNAVYSGTLEGLATDSADWYAFDAAAGATIRARAQSGLGCLYLRDAAGTELGFTCTAGYAELGEAIATAPVTGTYYVEYTYLQPDAYWFSLAVDAAPATPLLDVPLLVGGGAVAPVSAASQSGDHVVVAVVDTGINLYHDFFAAPALTAHPSTWLPGFPSSATSVSLTLNAADYPTARDADEATFAGLDLTTYDPGADTFDTNLYTFPGTRVVGAVSFGEYEPARPPLPVLDDNGHGTHSAGLAAGANLAAADGNVLVVMVEVGSGTFEDGVRWAARQPWIDAVSVSLGMRANVPYTTSPIGDRTGIEWAVHDAELAGKPVFVASGNGFSNTGVAPDHCTTYTSPYTGPAWTTRIGAAEAGNGNPTWWHCVPVDAIARTNVLSPDYVDQRAGTSASGTSAATPNAAGHFAHLLLAGREAGSTASRATVRDYLLRSAAPPPLSVSAGDPSVYPVSLVSQGYGLIDDAALADATARLVAASGPKPRPETTEWFARDEAVRRSLWGPGSATAGQSIVVPDVPQDDAGSGADAPDTRSDDVEVVPGVLYTATGTVPVLDEDWYAFDATAGDEVRTTLAARYACLDVMDPAGVVRGTHCDWDLGSTVPQVTVDVTGTWYLRVRPYVPGDYVFGFGLNGPPPDEQPLTAAVPQDDAGSGGDAPGRRSDEVVVAPGVRYTGIVTGYAQDEHDWYAFEATAGDYVETSFDGTALLACVSVVDPTGAARTNAYCDSGSGVEYHVPIDQTGTWYVHVQSLVAQDYVVGFGVNGPPPAGPPLPVPGDTVPEESQDDAGSGADAPDTRSDDVVVAPGVRHTGRLAGYPGEATDWYAFQGTAGDSLWARIQAETSACLDIVDPAGLVRETQCDERLGTSSRLMTLDTTGTWYLRVRTYLYTGGGYAFGIGINGVLPDV